MMPRSRWAVRWAVASVLLLVALAFRAWHFGDPVYGIDEQYYLLAGDRMLHGAVPFIDIWDRKPIGLFLLFAAIRTLPGDGILAYQLVATVFAWATALVVVRMARMVGANDRGTLIAGFTYIAGLSLLGGGGGQSPVFYNLPVALAALLTLRLPALADARRTGAIIGSGVAACLLAGLAIQLKYTPAVEGAFFGLAHLWFLRRAGAQVWTIAGAAMLWVAMGIGPTLAAIAYYAAKGPAALATFWFANVTSIALRPGYPADQLVMRLLGIAAQLWPSLLAAVLAWRRRGRGRETILLLLFGWLAFALAGFLAIGTFFDHYALPLVAPLAVAAAPVFGRSKRLMAFALAVPVGILIVEAILHPSDAVGARRVAAIMKANSGDECPYVFVGDTITYHLADACLPTRYAFPNLLAYSTEQGAVGIDEAAEVRRILARRPPVIVTADRRLSIWNPGSLRAVKSALARDYHPIFTTPRRGWNTVVYLRNDRRVMREPSARP